MTATRPIRSPMSALPSCSPINRRSGLGRGSAFLGDTQDVVGGLDPLEARQRFGVAGSKIGVMRLGEAAVGGADLAEIGVRGELQHVERTHLVPAAAAVARPAPLIMIGMGVAVGAAPLL